MIWKCIYFSSQCRVEHAKRNFISPRVHVLLGSLKSGTMIKKSPYFFFEPIMPNLKPWLWREVPLFELQFSIRLPAITQLKNGRVGSREDVTSSNQEKPVSRKSRKFSGAFRVTFSLCRQTEGVSRHEALLLFKFLFLLQHIKRSALQNKRVGVSEMAFRTWNAFRTF